MVTGKTRRDDRATGGLLVILGIALAVVIGFVAFNQGYFGNNNISQNGVAPATNSANSGTENSLEPAAGSTDSGTTTTPDQEPTTNAQ